MAHELSFINGVAEFAFIEGTPVWHGFGQAIPEDQRDNLDAWLYASNMGNWSISEAPCLAWDAASESLVTMNSQKMLYRSDNRTPLAIVGSNFHVVQPKEVVNFFERIIKEMGFKMVTCGVLHGGRVLWAQADIGAPVEILGQERVEGKLLLSTANGIGRKTRAQYTTTCVVCNNTLNAAFGSSTDYVELSHASEFKAEDFHAALELRPEAFLRWKHAAELMAQAKMDHKEAGVFFDTVFNGKLIIPEGLSLSQEQLEELQADRGNGRAIDKCLELFAGEQLGGNLVARNHTVWGAVNCVTEYIDHWRPCQTMDSRIDRAWFGDGSKIKDRAWVEALNLAA